MSKLKNTIERLHVDWMLLVFLIGVTNVKLYVKAAVVLAYIAYLLYKKVSFPRRLPGVSPFYLFVLVAGTFSSLINGSFNVHGYWLGFVLGGAQWLIAGAASYLLYIVVASKDHKETEATIKAFFVINGIFCLYQIFQMAILSGGHFPYWYWDASDQFGSSTGDHVRGVFGSNSLTNAAINILGALYFIYNKELRWAIFCAVIMMLCTSNMTLAFFVLTTILMIVFAKQRAVKINALIVIVCMIVLYPILSPSNISYLRTTYHEKYLISDTLETADRGAAQRHSTIIRSNNQELDYPAELMDMKYYATLHLKPNSNVALEQGSIKYFLRRWYGYKDDEEMPPELKHMPVKVFSVKQVIDYNTSSLSHFVFGAGIGNFSSKLAIKMTGLGLQGYYPPNYIYISKDFFQYHFCTLLYVLSQPVSQHSIINMPFSVYGQLAGEYGLIGVIITIIFYIGFFVKNRKYLSYGRYLWVPIAMYWGFEYWLEMISLMVIFELLMFSNIKAVKNDAVES